VSFSLLHWWWHSYLLKKGDLAFRNFGPLGSFPFPSPSALFTVSCCYRSSSLFVAELGCCCGLWSGESYLWCDLTTTGGEKSSVEMGFLCWQLWMREETMVSWSIMGWLGRVGAAGSYYGLRVVSYKDGHGYYRLDNGCWRERCRCWRGAGWLTMEELAREGGMVSCGRKRRMVFNNKEGRWLFAFVFNFLFLQMSLWREDEDGLSSLDGG